MRSVLLLLLALLLVSHSPVEAGSRLWERPPHHPKRLNPRWAHFPSASLGLSAASPWPNKLIPICFSGRVAEMTMAPFIRRAMDLWYAAGLPSDYKVEKASDHRCTNQRAEVLMVYLAETFGPLSTTVGTHDHTVNGETGAKMKIQLRTDLLPDITANIAHELGHSWGLYHEHQTPQYWDPHTGVAKLFKFNCEALGDYHLHADKTYDQLYSSGGLCRNWYTAASFQFSAAEFLGIPHAITNKRSIVDNLSWADVDWNSIMLYPSTLGGRFPGGPYPLEHTRVVPDDPEEDVMVYPNIVPSPGDVEGIRHIYEVPRRVPIDSLLNDPESEHFLRFQQLAPGCD